MIVTGRRELTKSVGPKVDGLVFTEAMRTVIFIRSIGRVAITDLT